MTCPNCGAEGVDNQADCSRCQSSDCSACGARVDVLANYCSRCGQPVRAQLLSEPPAASSSVWAPPHLRQRVLASRASLEGERKQVTVLFADLRASLSVLSGLDPEDGQALLDAVLGAMVDAVHRYEGAVNQVMGDGIMALFGAPIAHEDHALRAACAALGMQETVRALRDPSWEARGTRPQIRVGVHSGDVAIRTVHNDLSMDYRAVGPTTHIAARMEQLATPGSVWLTGDTVKFGQGRLRTTLIGPTMVKGVATPIEVHELNGISVRTRFQANALRGLSELVGREETLARLEAALASARAGNRQTAVLHGEPGVGKSRLCYELLQRAADSVRMLEASSSSYLSTRPFGLLASVLRALLGIDDNDNLERVMAKVQRSLSERAEPASKLPVALELLDVPHRDAAWEQADPLQKRRRIGQLLRELLHAWSASGPSVLLCEDLHWCDPQSLEFISELVEDPPGPQLLLLLTHRSELVPPWAGCEHVISCEVRALDAATSERLLGSLLGQAESLGPLRSWLAMRTDGNPFFIEESARALVETGMVQNRASDVPVGRGEVPASIEALLSARVDRLSEAALELLQAAAVLDDHGPSEALREIASLSPREYAERIAALTRAELLYEAVALLPAGEASSQPMAATIRFKHALIQEVVYKRLLRPRRRALHARVVEVMEQQYRERLGEHVVLLAEHAYRAELWARCAHYQRLACIRAAGRGANALAVVHLERGLEAQRHLPDDPELQRAAIDLRLTAPAALLPVGAFERAIALLNEAATMAEQLQDLGRLARASSQLSTLLWTVGRYDEARQRADQCLELARQLEGDQFALEVAARYNTAMVQHAQGDFAAARDGLDRLLVQFSGATERRRIGWAGYPSVLIRTFIISVSSMTGSFADAARAFAEGSAVAEQVGHAFSRTIIMEQYAMCLLAQGETERAAELLERCVELCRLEDVHVMYAASAIHLGAALLELGALDRARALIESVDDVALARAGHYATDYQLITLSELALRSGQHEQAHAVAEHAVSEALSVGEHGFHVRALIQLGDVLAERAEQRVRALAVYAEALEQADRLEMRPWSALALSGIGRVYAESFQYGLATPAFDAARDIWTELEAPRRVAQVAALRRRWSL